MEQVNWNLADLYTDLAQIKVDLKEIKAAALGFCEKYNDLSEITKSGFLSSIKEYEKLFEKLSYPACYVELLYNENSSEENGALLNFVQEECTAIAKELLAYELALVNMDDDQFSALTDEENGIEVYAHYLHTLRKGRPHRLSNSEERIVMEKSLTGREAFSRLFDETITNTKFYLENGTKQVTESEVLSLLHSHERDARKEASESLTVGLRERNHVLSYITNTLLKDKEINDRLFKYERSESSRHESDDVDTGVVDTMTATVAENYGIVAKYYKLKAKILGLSPLYHYDRYAPLEEHTSNISWEQSRDMVIKSYADFSPDFGAMASRFFDEGWIDAFPKEGKRSGAFCAGVTPSHHPYVLTNFLGKDRDVMTVAHELGHGIHDLLASKQTYSNYSPSLAAAETASVFGEQLTFDMLKAQEGIGDKEKLSLICGKIEDTFATVFRQTAMYRFEQAVHARRREGEIPAAVIGDIWQEKLQEMFLDSVILEDDHKLWWSYIPHFVHTPFYVYAYAFGQLMVMALYGKYKEMGDDFVPQYRELLSMGGSDNVVNIMRKSGFDITVKDFWQSGLVAIDNMVNEAQTLFDSINS